VPNIIIGLSHQVKAFSHFINGFILVTHLLTGPTFWVSTIKQDIKRGTQFILLFPTKTLFLKLLNKSSSSNKFWTQMYSWFFNNLTYWSKFQGSVKAVMQSDGNLVLYNAMKRRQWSSETNYNRPANLVLRNDGNLVINSEDGDFVWATNTTALCSGLKKYFLWSQNQASITSITEMLFSTSAKTCQL
jgi:hypothetical protein